MDISICDRCGKIVSRYHKRQLFDIEAAFNLGGERGGWCRKNLSFCDDCYKIFHEFIMKELGNPPENVIFTRAELEKEAQLDLSFGGDEGNEVYIPPRVNYRRHY